MMHRPNITIAAKHFLLSLVLMLASFQATAEEQSVTLTAGWNSLSLTVEDSDAFDDLRDNSVERIFLWNSLEQRWMHYDFTRSIGDITSISSLRTYMVKTASSTTITFSGDTTSIQDTDLLDERWNLITATETETYSELVSRFTEARPSLSISSLYASSGEVWETLEGEDTIQAGAQLWIKAVGTGGSDPSITGQPPLLQFSLTGSTSLQTLDDVVETTPARPISGLSRKMARRSATSNLYASKKDGTTTPAVSGDIPLKVFYSAIDPIGKYVYLALDPTGSNALMSEENCGLYQVKVADNSYRCVVEGHYLRDMDEDYRATLSKQKPIQFDGDSNVYFSATRFTVTSGNIQLDQWSPLVYKYAPGSSQLTSITHDAMTLRYFMVLNSGELIYEGRNSITGSDALWMYQGTQSIRLSDTPPDTILKDSYNSVFWIDRMADNRTALKFVRPRNPAGKLESYLALDRGAPDSMSISDDGKLYGIYRNGNQISVQRLMPHDAEPLITLNLNYLNNSGLTPLQISQGDIYYIEEDNSGFFGPKSVIKRIDLDAETGTEPETLLSIRSMDIYSWELSAGAIHFSGLDQAVTKIVSAVIDITKVQLGLGEEEYLKTAYMDSAIDANNKVKDITVLKPIRAQVDNGEAPTVEITPSAEQRDLITLQFDKTMNEASVESEITLTSSNSNEGTGGVVDTLPIWFYSTLHLIPDGDGLGGGGVTEGLQSTSNYQLSLNGATDSFGNGLDGDGVSGQLDYAMAFTGKLTIADLAIEEGDEGNQEANLVVRLDFSDSLGSTNETTVTVDYATEDGTGEADVDYLSSSGTLTFSPGETTKTIPLTIIGDLIDEADEAFTLTLSDASQARLPVGHTAITIEDQDPEPVVIFSFTTGQYLYEDQQPLSLNFNLSQPSGKEIVIPYTLSGTASSQLDYTLAPSAEIRLLPGETAAALTLTPLEESQSETNETLSISIGSPTHASFEGEQTHTVRLVDALATVIEGVDEITAGVDYVPGRLYALSSEWNPLVCGDESVSDQANFVLAKANGAGRIAVAAHEGILLRDELDNMRFNTQLLDWLATQEGGVGYTTGHREWVNTTNVNPLITVLEAEGGSLQEVSGIVTEQQLEELSVLIVGNSWEQFTSDEKSLIDLWNQQGGGLLLVGLGWSWPMYNSSTLPEYPINQLAEPFEIMWLGGTVTDTDAANEVRYSEFTSSCALSRVPLNDTGITWGGSYPSGNNESCTGETIEAQDCSHGRDVTHNDDSDGHAGFSFTKLDSSGHELAASATEWGCVKDNVTDLIWEVKTDDGGVHDKDNAYRWGGISAIGRAHADVKGTYYDDWNELVNGTNSESLCGYSDWRVPTLEELRSISNKYSYRPAIDTNYFPNTPAAWFWSSSPNANYSHYAWELSFDYGDDNYYYRNYFSHVRLVRSGQ